MANAPHSSQSLSPDLLPQATGNKDAGFAGLTPQDYFVLSRIDGKTPVRLLQQLTGLGAAAVSEALFRLAQNGHVVLPGLAIEVVKPEPKALRPAVPANPIPVRPPASAEPPVRPGGDEPLPEAAPERSGELLSYELTRRKFPIPFEQFAFDPLELEGAGAMTDEQKKVVLYFQHHLRRVTYYDLLGVQQTADDRQIRKAYFRLSKAFHPDRWFRKDVGVFGEHISDVFKWLNRAYEVLSSPKKRRGYDELLRRGFVGEWQLEEKSGAPPSGPVAAQPSAPVSASEPAPPRPAAMLMVRARRAEGQGAWKEAVDLYGRAMQLEPSLDLRIRLIECMLKANLDPREIDRELHGGPAEATEDKRLLLLEAEVARRLGHMDRAEACYRRVLALEPSNPVARMGLDRLKS